MLKLRWFRFRLRSLLILALLCATAAAFAGRQLRAYRLEQQALAQLPVTTVQRAKYDLMTFT